MTVAISRVKPPTIENIPEELTERPQWVLWRYEQRGGKLTKVPYTDTGHRASSTNLLTWTTCAMAFLAYERGDYDGIGLVFSSGDSYAGVDLDACRDPKSGELEGWAQEIVARAGDEGYVEVSPSGTGVHIIVKGTVRKGGMRKGKVEMYSRGRFFAFTGRAL